MIYKNIDKRVSKYVYKVGQNITLISRLKDYIESPL